MWSSWPWVSTSASTSSSRSRIAAKSGRIRSTPGWWSSGNSTPQSTISRRPSYSKTVMLRPTSPRPPSGMTRRPPCGSSAGADSSGWGWLSVSFGWDGRIRAGRRRPARRAAQRPRRRRAPPAASARAGCRARRAARAWPWRWWRRSWDPITASIAGSTAVKMASARAWSPASNASTMAPAGAGRVADDADEAGRAVGQPAEVGDVVAGVDGVAELLSVQAAARSRRRRP